MLQRHFRLLLGIGVARGARKRRSKVLRHGNAPEVIHYHPREPQFLDQKRQVARLATRRTLIAQFIGIERDPPLAGKPPNRTTAPDPALLWGQLAAECEGIPLRWGPQRL